MTGPEVWTPRRLLQWAARDFAAREIEAPRLDAELLLARALQVDRVALYLDLDRPLDDDELGVVRGLIQRRRAREPVAYILGKREFYGRPFAVSRHVLVPRPETELLVELALRRIQSEEVLEFWDLCTGSGAVGVSLLAERAGLRGVLTDISERALEVAQQNATALGVDDRLRLLHGDLFGPFEGTAQAAVIVANPPYVSQDEHATLAPEINQFEPEQALIAGDEGWAVIDRLIAELPARLTPRGRAFVEVGEGQAQGTLQRARERGLSHGAAHKDLAGIERVVELGL